MCHLEGKVKVALGNTEGKKVKMVGRVGIPFHFQQDVFFFKKKVS